MGTAVREWPDLVQQYFMTRAVVPASGKFAALHAAFWRGGAFLYVPSGVEIDAPLYGHLRGTLGKTFTHTLVVLDDRARAVFVNEFSSVTADHQALHNGAVELIVNRGAGLKYVSLQEWGRHVWQFTHERVAGLDSRLTWTGW